MDNCLDVLQWNARSIMRNLGEFQRIVDEMKPRVICLTETWLKANSNFSLRGYEIFRGDRIDAVAGGVAILVRRELKYSEISLNVYNNGSMDCVALKLTLKTRVLSLLVCYCPPLMLSSDELEFYYRQLNGSIIVCGDFNARHMDWDSGNSNRAGNVLSDFILNSNNLAMFTDKDLGTRYDTRFDTMSTIDLFIGDSSLLPNLKVSRKAVTGFSDHFPVLLEIDLVPCWSEIRFRGRWKINQELWAKWFMLLQTINISLAGSIGECIQSFADNVTGVASKVFRHSSGRYSPKLSAPWWTEECSLARALKRRAKRRLRRNHNQENILNYKRESAKCKRLLRRTKRAYWRSYCSALTSRTPIGVVWKVFNSIRRRQPPDVFPLDADRVLTAVDKANILAQWYETHFVAPPIRGDILEMECEVSRAIAFCHDAYNIPFKSEELEDILVGLPHNKAAGVDDIPYEFLSHLDGNFKIGLLGIFNKCWLEGEFPREWKHALVMPLLKPGKDPTVPVSYRPLCLLSTLSKVFEKLIMNRLSWFLESHSLLPEYQAGFRRNRSTHDQLVRLEHVICKSLKEKKVVISVYFDISKAYDKIKHLAVLVKLARLGVNGRLLAILKSFLSERSFQVSLLGQLSDVRQVSDGVTQGAILSPLLFVVFLSDLPDLVDVHISAFADDICLYTTSDSYVFALEKMQEALDLFGNWCESWGVTINTDKTFVQYFTRKKINNPPVLVFNNSQLRYQRVCRYLGLLFDSPYLTWKDHIDYLVVDCKKRLNILKAVASTSWGAERKTLLQLYKGFILSKITYGSVAYGSASKSLFGKLEVIQNSALRIATGALRSSPIGALRCEVNVPSIGCVVELLTVKYFIKAKSFSRLNPVRSEVLGDLGSTENLRWSHFAYRIPGILRALHSCRRLGIPQFDDLPVVNYSPIPPWLRLNIMVKLDVGITSVKNLPINIRLSLSNMMLLHLYNDHLQIFTDGSKAYVHNEWRVGSAFYVKNEDLKFKFRVGGVHSVLVAELFAVYKALQWVLGRIASVVQNVVILTDSLSALQGLQNGSNKARFLVFECWRLLKRLMEHHCMLVFQWIPSHVGI